MRDTVLHVANSYSAAQAEPFASHPIAEYVRNDLTVAVRRAIGPRQQGLVVESSAGAGRWAGIPWAAVFDPRVTTTATSGYYVVYLFSESHRCIYLSLNQGTTAVTEEFGVLGYRILSERAELIRNRLPEFLEEFPVRSISLGTAGRLPRGYEAGHALGKKYEYGNLPSLADMESDLQRLIAAYLKLTFRGGIDFIETSSEEEFRGSGPGTLLERRRYRMHRTIERNPKAAEEVKRHHGYECKACGMTFIAKYGELGKNYIEAHHLKALATLEEDQSVEYDIATDFTVLCANCHRMIHRTENPADLQTFRQRLI